MCNNSSNTVQTHRLDHFMQPISQIHFNFAILWQIRSEATYVQQFIFRSYNKTFMLILCIISKGFHVWTLRPRQDIAWPTETARKTLENIHNSMNISRAGKHPKPIITLRQTAKKSMTSSLLGKRSINPSLLGKRISSPSLLGKRTASIKQPLHILTKTHKQGTRLLTTL